MQLKKRAVSMINREVCRVPLGWQHPTDRSGQLGLCVYETTTEGTPLTPAFPDTAAGRWALVHSCATRVSVFADRRPNAEAWIELLVGGNAVPDLKQ
jgi:hypothetical protein